MNSLPVDPPIQLFVLTDGPADPGPLVEALEAGGAEVARIPVPEPGRPIPFAELAQAKFVLLAASAESVIPAALSALPPERWRRCELPVLLADPRAELRSLCTWAGIAYDQALLTPLEAAARISEDLAPGGPRSSPFASVSTASFPTALATAGGTLLISTYQTHRLVCVRVRDGELNTHFRGFEKPMGIAVAAGRIALGTRTEIWDLRDVPAAAPKVEPAGTHDACYVPRARLVTGDIAVHDLAFAGGGLWLVATSFSCLATLDGDHSFVPRWTPGFISRLAPEDRCHLNGLAIVDDRPAFVTALGTTDEPGGWRAGKASGGVLIDLASGEIALAGLSMPHSPRWHQGRLWVLESGRGTLGVADLDAGTVQTVAELPGFTRGLAFAGDTAFVGLSQIRESSTFGDLPLTDRLQERQSGVWMVDLRTGEITGFLRFDDLVQEIFDVAFLPGPRWPEIAEATDDTTARTFVLP
jgi:uncharacterized protein (TIGR03032 family)